MEDRALKRATSHTVTPPVKLDKGHALIVAQFQRNADLRLDIDARLKLLQLRQQRFPEAAHSSGIMSPPN